jgi:hypothetical protein
MASITPRTPTDDAWLGFGFGLNETIGRDAKNLSLARARHTHTWDG